VVVEHRLLLAVVEAEKRRGRGMGSRDGLTIPRTAGAGWCEHSSGSALELGV